MARQDFCFAVAVTDGSFFLPGSVVPTGPSCATGAGKIAGAMRESTPADCVGGSGAISGLAASWAELRAGADEVVVSEEHDVIPRRSRLARANR